MKKTPLSLLIVAIFVFSTALSIGIDNETTPPPDGNVDDTREYTHTVLGEEFSATWCPHCPAVVGYMHTIYDTGSYDFYYVTHVCDMNSYSNTRRIEMGVTGYPTVVFDGGYQSIVGNVGSTTPYINALNSCGARTVPDVDLEMSVQWLGDAEMHIEVDVTNNGASSYSGTLRVSVTEIVSRWICYSTVNYDFAMIGDYAIKQSVTVPAGQTSTYSANWDGDTYGFGDITINNIQVTAAVFAQASPNYVDETTSAIPTTDSPPTISNVQATPSIQAPGGPVNITATVTDDIGVNTVTACITPPGASTPTDHLMTHGSGDTYYYTATYSTLGTYDYYIRALDTGGNDATSPTQDFLIWEYNPPIITNIQATTLTGDNIDITCSVQDDTAVDTVSINITDPLGGTIQASMTPTGGDTYTYSGTFATLGGYLYTISANDTAGNTITTPSHVLMRQMMYSGWNLVTLPLVSEHTAGTLGENISGCTTVCRFNGDSQTYTTHVVGIPYNDFPILDGVGYFLYVNTPGIFTATGECISSATVHLYQQWNMIGWYRDTATIASSLGAALDDCTTICKYDAVVGSYSTHVVGIPYNDFTIEWGMGLFVYTTSESDWQGTG